VEERYRLFDKTLRALHNAGALPELVLIGSWCQHIYKFAFDNKNEIPSLITSDIDFLIPYPHTFKKKINVPDIMEGLGFEMVASPVSGYTKYIRRELEVEFLTPEVGRGLDKPRMVKDLNIQAQGLRYLVMLQEHVEKVNYKGIPVTIVQPEAYVLHKFLISGRRKKSIKREKDLSSARQMGEFLMKFADRMEKMNELLNDIHPKWKKDILAIIQEQMPELHEKLKRSP
jgi:hypothetical protein